MKKFENAIYVTNTVKEELPEEVLLFIINLVRNLHKEIPEVDYLQVLKIRNNILILKQEVPEFTTALNTFDYIILGVNGKNGLETILEGLKKEKNYEPKAS